MTDSSPFVDIPKNSRSTVSSVSGTPFKRLSFEGNQELENLKLQTKALSYELKECKNNLELEKVEHEGQVNDLIKQLKDQQTKYEAILSDQIYYYNQNKELTEKFNNAQKQFNEERDELRFQLTNTHKEFSALKSHSDTLQADLNSQKSKLVELQNNLDYQIKNSSSEFEELTRELQSYKDLVHQLRSESLEKDNELEILRSKLKSTPTESEIQCNQEVEKRLKDQVQYTKDLEQKNLQQAEQIKKLLLNKQNIEILKDEKAALQAKLESLDNLNNQINELTLQNLNLTQELSGWKVYLSDVEDVDTFFKNTKFLKDENLILTNNFAKLNSDLKNLQKDYDELFIKKETTSKDLEILKDKYDNLLKVNYELEQQKSLLFEESNFLREQLKNLDHELTLNEDDKSKYIQSLEGIIGQYKKQLNELTEQQQSQVETSNKRQRTDNDEDTTRNFQTSIMKLKDELLQLNNDKARLTNDNIILLKKLESMQSINEQKVRILQLRNNPFQNDQTIKKAQLDVLERMNSDLLGKTKFVDTVPKSVFDKSELDKQGLENEIHNLNKRIRRLREIFRAKSLEFIDSVHSLLGYKIEFMPSNKIKLISRYIKNDQNCIIIDTANGTLKTNKFNDEDSEFFKVYDNLIAYWIKDKNEIPCFLGALNLELYEKEKEHLEGS